LTLEGEFQSPQITIAYLLIDSAFSPFFSNFESRVLARGMSDGNAPSVDELRGTSSFVYHTIACRNRKNEILKIIPII
jgi:hypothetical protein